MTTKLSRPSFQAEKSALNEFDEREARGPVFDKTVRLRAVASPHSVDGSQIR